MITSKELLEKTGISRATLNNYIARGLLTRPVVASPEVRGGNRPRQIGYFPDDALARVGQILQLKQEGLSMEEIASRIAPQEIANSPAPAPHPATGSAQVISHPAAVTKQPLVVTIDQMPHPAYMVNHRFEVVWFNDKARGALGGALSQLAARTEERSIFRLLLANEDANSHPSRDELLRLNIALAKERMELAAISQPLQPIAAAKINLLEQLYAETSPVTAAPVVELPVRLQEVSGDRVENYCAFASYFREG
ncbi:MAG TPA: MerR family transcriptional regulator, partial [Burkholderiales bacterium]|nr:MerR family transcriptional regulator [Burkholderiales bacterium]